MTAWLSRHPRPIRWGLLLLLGCANTLAFAPFNFAIIPLFSLALLLLLLANRPAPQRPKQGFGYGFIYGFGWFATGISWVHVSIDSFGGLPLVVSFALMALLAAYLALFPALCCYLLLTISPNPRYWPLSFAPIWLFSEFLRSSLLTGFPWLSLGYSQLNTPLAGYGPVIGEIGISFVLCQSAALIFIVFTTAKKARPISLAFSGLSALYLTALALQQINWVTPTGITKKVALVQGNIEQELRWAPENEQPTIQKYRDLTRENYDVDLIIWPEAAIPSLEISANEELHNIEAALMMHHTALITGILDYNFESRDIYNSLITLGLKEPTDSTGQYYYPHSNRYNKHHLLPIGEFVPFETLLRPIAPLFDLPMSSFSRGEAKQTNLRANGMNIVPAICYEIIFPRLVRQNIHSDSDVILTVSNDAWFRDSIGPLQHMQIAQMRALEFGRPLLRATNNGVTAITNEKGQISQQLPQFISGVLKGEIALVSGLTPYRRLGDWPLIGLSLLLIAIALIITKKSTAHRQPALDDKPEA